VNTLSKRSANKVFDKILGIDISVLSWAKTRSKKKKLRNPPQKVTGKKNQKHVHGLLGFFRPPMFVFLLKFFSDRVEIDEKAILT
jgi:hypothetical protein